MSCDIQSIKKERILLNFLKKDSHLHKKVLFYKQKVMKNYAHLNLLDLVLLQQKKLVMQLLEINAKEN